MAMSSRVRTTACSSLAAAKTQLRALIRTKLRTLSPAYIKEQSKAVATQLASLPFLEQCSGIGVFLSMRSKKTGHVQGEIDSTPILSRLLSPRGAGVFVPKVTDFVHGGMEMLRLSSGATEVSAYALNRWKIPEPSDVQVCDIMFRNILYTSILCVYVNVFLLIILVPSRSGRCMLLADFFFVI